MPPDSYPLTAQDWSPRLNLPYLAAGQAQKHVTVNEAISALDGLIQTAVESAALAAEPAAPPDGALYILPDDRTGPEWSLHPPGSLLRFGDGGWTRLAAGDGAVAYDREAGRLLVRIGGLWRPLGAALGELGALSRLGVGTEADAINPLAAKVNKALFTAREVGEGGDGDLRLTFNKETSADVLSLLLQTGYAGRAELGLVGDDQLRLRTSADGLTWRDALLCRPDGSVRVGAADGVEVRPDGGLEIISGGAQPARIDFKNAGADDFDVRLQHFGDFGLVITAPGRVLSQFLFDVAPGETPLVLLTFDGTNYDLRRVRFGPAGSGPNGGRALYV